MVPGAAGDQVGKQEPQANPASLPTSMLDLESPITGSSKVRTSSRLEPAYASPSLRRIQRSMRGKHEGGAAPPCAVPGRLGLGPYPKMAPILMVLLLWRT